MYSYTELLNKFNRSSIPGKLSYKLENNTYVLVRENSTYANENIQYIFYIKLHDSIIATITQDKIVLDSCGYRTLTTKDRLNKILDDNKVNWKIFQVNHIWFVYPTRYTSYDDRDESRLKYADKITFKYEFNCKIGNFWDVLNFAQDNTIELNQLKHRIIKFINGYYESFKTGKLGIPSNGDCLFCRFNMGSDKDHLLAHMEESYYVPSLLVLVANESRNLSTLARNSLYQWSVNDPDYIELLPIIGYQIRKALYKYMLDKLIYNS